MCENESGEEHKDERNFRLPVPFFTEAPGD